MTSYSTSLFIFRRDLRLHDNTALHEALRLSQQVIPCFIFDPRQIEPHPYQSQPGLQFMLQSIDDLQQQLQTAGGKLALYHAPPEQAIKQLAEQHHIEAVFINRDYTPFSRRRDDELDAVCNRLGIALHILPDLLLNEPEQAVKSDKTAYKVFTAFYNNARQFPVTLPQALPEQSFLTAASELTIEQLGLSTAESSIKGGRKQALAILERLGDCADYQNTRDFPALDATSKLSAHLKFGTCSVREVYYAVIERLGSEHPLIRQLYWRDFFTHIAYHFPQVFGRAFVERFADLHWDNNPDHFQAWCDGKTGFPIVDAGMRELNATGFMHNRVRMIVASFLVKDLHIDWRWGERYFARHLVDYDPCVNNGNWQWAASTGCDAQPYFRIFNPWLQQLKFDPDCRYIYRWLPELQAFPPKIIHQWDKKHSVCGYPAPIIDHGRESQLAKARFKEMINK
ncbi:deoxyribodipyrimidine photo-lyase type I [Methylobacter tundripaludum]|uniref:Deoxyribodipyrimidine photo-lyase n=1 Tax=Methylobacter tundripaludum TaxID=173365 RepID=A0A2S6GIU6_9GAMM|nr:deoxyribodipyrimidine photo-lyase [Methylobacter tundripaludum]PPK65139.1 deoxyribodipyrimidine photo-lyase type I [Methylobacter tundripaludum]